tara:strand:+ start:3689 stop:4048 length:360 start_codon:yes stop_codon:yes gene_type:complete
VAVTVTLIEDHKGYTGPKVHGDEYYVDALCNVTAYETGGVVVNASDLGLSTIHQVLITGREESGTNVIVDSVHAEVSTTGAYESGTSFKLHATIMSTGGATANAATTVNMVRVRVYGLL